MTTSSPASVTTNRSPSQTQIRVTSRFALSLSDAPPEEMPAPVKRGPGRPPGSKNKKTLAKEAAAGPGASVNPVTTPAAGDGAVAAQKSKRGVEYECDTVTYLRRGRLVFQSSRHVAVQQPDVFAWRRYSPKLDMTDTLNLAQVSKAYRDAVWSVDGVRSLEEKIEPHIVKIGRKALVTEPLYWAATHGKRARGQGLPGVRGGREQGCDSREQDSSAHRRLAMATRRW